MLSTYCILSNFPTAGLSAKAIAIIKTATNKAQLYHQIQEGISWHSAKVSLRKKTSNTLDAIAFDIYSLLIQLHQELVNLTKITAAAVISFTRSVDALEKEHPRRILNKQLEIPMTFTADAHIRKNHVYSSFHNSLVKDQAHKNYALKHLYSLSNTEVLLAKLGWSIEDIKIGIKHLTIDVFKNQVYLHIPREITVRKEKKRIKGLSRFVSKNDYVQILIDKCWSKADPYKLEIIDWDEFIAQGNTGDFYELHLTPFAVTCSCHAASGTAKAFQQDDKAYLFLRNHPQLLGQLPDKHIFSVWKYLGVECLQQYEQAYKDREEKAHRFSEDFLEEIEF